MIDFKTIKVPALLIIKSELCFDNLDDVMVTLRLNKKAKCILLLELIRNSNQEIMTYNVFFDGKIKKFSIYAYEIEIYDMVYS